MNQGTVKPEVMQRLQLPDLGKSVQDFDPIVLAKMKSDSYNQITGDLGGMDCLKCRNKGSIAYPKDDGSGGVYTLPCSCMTMRRCILAMERSGLKDIIRQCTFEKYQASATWQRKAKEIATSYAENPSGWFLACGQSGSGKTHLCTAICRKLLLDGRQVVYMSWRQDVTDIKAASLDSERRAERMEELKTASYLYIDDLFKMGTNADGDIRPTVADISIAFEIINHRYINRLPTVISSELMPEELLRIDEATGGRIVELAKGNTLAISKDTRKNYRLQGIVSL